MPSYLWAWHNEHHLVWIRILTAVDVTMFAGRGIVLVVVASVAMLATAAICVVQMRWASLFSGRLWPLALLGPMLLLSAADATDCGLPIDAVYPLTSVFMLASLVLFDGAETPWNRTTWRRMAAILAAMAAGFSNAVGLAIWPVLLWAAWRGRTPQSWQAAVAVIGAFYIWLYVNGIPLTPGSGGAAASASVLAHASHISAYLLTYLGLPFSLATWLVLPGRLFGAVVLFLSLFVVVADGLSQRDIGRGHRIAVGLVLLGLGIALLAAIGRTDMSAPVMVPSRYTPFVALLHVGLIWQLLPRIESWASTSVRHRAVQAAAMVMVAVVLSAQVMIGQALARWSDRYAEAARRFLQGDNNPAILAVVYSDDTQALQLRALLLAHGVPR